MAALYNIEGTVYDEAGNPATGRTVHVYERSNGFLYRTLTTNGQGRFFTFCADDREYFVVVQPQDGLDASNAKIYDKVRPKTFAPTQGLNDIGVPGTMGFGVGTCPALPQGMVPMTGFDDIYHENYGNYQYTDGSIMVWVPAFWYKYGNGTNGLAINDVSIKKFDSYANEAAANADGHTIHRAFINGGLIKPGFFFDKYPNAVNKDMKCLSSLKGELYSHAPTSGAPSTPPTELIGKTWRDMEVTPVGELPMPGECFLGGKKRGSKFFPTTVFMWSALAMIVSAQKKYATKQTCEWVDDKYPATNKVPRYCQASNVGSVLRDTIDGSLTLVTYPYSNADYFGYVYNGISTNYASYSHNGQLNGIDYCPQGNKANFAWGTTKRNGNAAIIALKKTVDVSTINFTYDATPVENTVKFNGHYEDVLGAGLVNSTDYWRTDDKPYFNGAIDSSTDAWRRDGSMIPSMDQVTATAPPGGTTNATLGTFYTAVADYGWARIGSKNNRYHSGPFSCDIAYYGYSESSSAYVFRMGLYT